MTTLLIIKERIKNFYANNDYYLIPIVKFICVLTAMLIINSKIGYMTQLKTFPVVGIISVLSSVMPVAVIVFVMSIVILAHVYALSLELAGIILGLFIIMYLLYYKFTPGDGVILLLVPVLFLLKIPYLAPLIVGLIYTPVSIISLAFGTILYFAIEYIGNNAVTISNLGAENAIQKVTLLTDALMKNKDMYITIAVFAIVAVIVYIVRRRAIDYSWPISIVAGALSMLAAFLLANIVVNFTIESIFGLVFGTIISTVIAVILNFCVFSVDYTRTERTQFEDDEYYYYVKAVPKINISAPEVNVKRINARRSRKTR